jgi:hypothetical protein
LMGSGVRRGPVHQLEIRVHRLCGRLWLVMLYLRGGRRWELKHGAGEGKDDSAEESHVASEILPERLQGDKRESRGHWLRGATARKRINWSLHGVMRLA